VVTLATNDPKRPTIDLELYLTVQSEFTLSESAVDFGSVTAGTAVVHTIVVETTPGGSAAVVSVSAMGRGLSVDLNRRAASTGIMQLTVRFDTSLPVGQHYATAVVHTSSPDLPEMRIPVHVETTK
jgi:hypothetical protein